LQLIGTSEYSAAYKRKHGTASFRIQYGMSKLVCGQQSVVW